MALVDDLLRIASLLSDAADIQRRVDESWGALASPTGTRDPA